METTYSVGIYLRSGRTLGREFSTLDEARDYAQNAVPAMQGAEIYDGEDNLVESF